MRFNPNLCECSFPSVLRPRAIVPSSCALTAPVVILSPDANGKICLSILGTWHGPSWSAVHSLSSLLLSVQSLLNDKPYHNEPGFETERAAGDAERFNHVVLHETLRVAVCEAMERVSKLPPRLQDAAEATFEGYLPT